MAAENKPHAKNRSVMKIMKYNGTSSAAYQRKRKRGIIGVAM